MLDHEISNFYLPLGKVQAILSIPHSGEHIPEEFKEYLTDDLRALAEDVDYKVHELIDINQLVDNGIAVLVSNIHRTCVDLNRSEELAIIAWKKNSKGIKLQTKEMDEDLRVKLLNKYHVPYFYKLKATIDNLLLTQKKPVVIDLHSMPSRPTEYHLRVTPNQPLIRPDFCVSDIEGLSCTKDFIDNMQSQLMTFSKNVTQNIPYYGGHITRWINKEYPQVENIQIEISREIYMDEIRKELNSKLVSSLKPNLTKALISQFKKFIQ
jgi:N-formylglutamate deformylase